MLIFVNKAEVALVEEERSLSQEKLLSLELNKRETTDVK